MGRSKRKRRAEASMDSLAEPRRVRRDRKDKRTAETSISFQDDDYYMQNVKRTKGQRRKREPSHSTTGLRNFAQSDDQRVRDMIKLVEEEGQASNDGGFSEGSVSEQTRQRTKSSSSKTRTSKKKKNKEKNLDVSPKGIHSDESVGSI